MAQSAYYVALYAGISEYVVVLDGFVNVYKIHDMNQPSDNPSAADNQQETLTKVGMVQKKLAELPSNMLTMDLRRRFSEILPKVGDSNHSSQEVDKELDSLLSTAEALITIRQKI